MRHWIMVHRRAFEYFDGVPVRWIIDDLKADVDKLDREEELTQFDSEFSDHPDELGPRV